jgi:hypothetical protein
MLLQLENCVKYFSKQILDELKEVCITWVGGGCVRDYFSVGKLTSDIDLYFSCEEDYIKCKKYLTEQTTITLSKEEDGKTIVTKFPKPKAKVIFENDNVTKVIYKGRPYDLVRKWFTSASETIKEFDFTVCCAAVDIHNVYVHETFFIDLAKRQLMINKLPFPLSTMWRMQKYIQKGFYMCSGEMLKLSKAIGELQTNTPKGEENAVELQPMSEGGSPRFLTFD